MPIKTETTTCWRIVLPDGEDYSAYDEGVRHYDTERETSEAIKGHEISGATAKPFPAPCVLVTCDECEDFLDSDEFSFVHFTDTAEAVFGAREYDWIVKPDGRVFHDGCEPIEDDEATPTPTEETDRV